MLDGSIIKVHQDAMRSSYDKAAEAIGSSVGGLSTKIHAKVDSFGQLVNMLITPGQVHESQIAHDVWANEYCEFFLADKAYDIDGFRQALTEISRFSRQTKSMMYLPIGTCLLNLNPSLLARR